MSNPKKRHETVKFEKDDLTKLLSLEAKLASVSREVGELHHLVKQRMDHVEEYQIGQHNTILTQLSELAKDLKPLIPTVERHSTYFRISAYVIAGLITVPGLWSLVKWFVTRGGQ